MSSSQTYSPFRSVLLREWRRMTSRCLYFGVCIILPLFTLFFMATIFGNGQMENIPIGIVDQDNTASSRAIARNISAVPTFKVTRHFVNEEAARKAVQKKEIYGYLSIPPKFEQDAISGKNATLSYYYHYALLSVGGELMAAFETSLAPVSLSPIVMQAVALGVEQDKITTFLLPVQASNHPIYNPSLDYSVYLSQPFFFVLFQVLILLITVYAVGIEIKFRTADEWLFVAKGNMVTAVLGKLLPYTIIFILIGWLANYVMFGILHIPFQGSWLLMNMLIIPVFAISGYLSHHKYCFHGRLFGSYFIRCHFSGDQYVSFGTRCLLSFSCPAFYRNDAKYALRREWFYLPLAIGCDTMYLSVAGFCVASSSETCHRKS